MSCFIFSDFAEVEIWKVLLACLQWEIWFTLFHFEFMLHVFAEKKKIFNVYSHTKFEPVVGYMEHFLSMSVSVFLLKWLSEKTELPENLQMFWNRYLRNILAVCMTVETLILKWCRYGREKGGYSGIYRVKNYRWAEA